MVSGVDERDLAIDVGEFGCLVPRGDFILDDVFCTVFVTLA